MKKKEKLLIIGELFTLNSHEILNDMWFNFIKKHDTPFKSKFEFTQKFWDKEQHCSVTKQDMIYANLIWKEIYLKLTKYQLDELEENVVCGNFRIKMQNVKNLIKDKI